MKHWAERYIGQQWTRERDCYYWFRKIMLEQFGRDIPVVGDRFVRVDVPIQGDAVFIGNGHIGIMVSVDNKMMVLHAAPTIGVMLTTLGQEKIKGFWRYAPSA